MRIAPNAARSSSSLDARSRAEFYSDAVPGVGRRFCASLSVHTAVENVGGCIEEQVTMRYT